MSVSTLRPDGTAVNLGTLTGAATAHAATNDNSDASYVAKVVTSPTTFVGSFLLVDMATVAIPALSQIRSVTVRARLAQITGSRPCSVQLDDPTSGSDPGMAPVPTSSITTFTGPAETTNPAGTPWTQADLDRLRIRLGMVLNFYPETGQSTDMRVYELYADVLINEAPVAAVSTPTGTVTNDSSPPVAWTYTDPDSDPQERFQVKIFDLATYGPGTFDPETSTPIQSSGEVFSAALTWTPPAPLANGTYRAYVKVADAGSGGRYGAWVFSGFVLLVDVPATPVVTAQPSDPNMGVLINGRDNLLTANQADLDTNTAGWAVKTNCTIARATGVTAAHGGTALALTSIAPGNVEPTTTIGTGGVVVAHDQQYTALASFLSTGTDRTVRVSIYWYKSDGSASTVPVSAGSSVAETGGGLGATVQASVTALAPFDAAFAAVVPTVLSAAGSEGHLVDMISIAPQNSTVWTRGGLVNPAVYPEGTTLLLQRSDDGGATWVYVAGVAPSDFYGSFPPLESTLFLTDYAAPRGKALQYRAQALAVVGGKTLGSGWGPVTPVIMSSYSGCYLKSSSNPALNMAINLATNELIPTTVEPQGIHDQIIGRADPVIVSDVIRTAVFEELTFWFRSDAEFAAFEALRALQEPLLLQTCYGDAAGAEQWWIRLGAQEKAGRVTTDLMRTAQQRSVTISGTRVVAAPAIA